MIAKACRWRLFARRDAGSMLGMQNVVRTVHIRMSTIFTCATIPQPLKGHLAIYEELAKPSHTSYC